MPFNIVLYEPEIPTNTGNIGRLSLATGARLHLIKPFGFEIDDNRVKRAGLDYWKHVDLNIYDNFKSFLEKNPNSKLAFFSSHSKKEYWSVDYVDDLFLIFGKESLGLPEDIRHKHSAHLYSIPIDSTYVRSLNLANAVSVVIYEGMRQKRMKSSL